MQAGDTFYFHRGIDDHLWAVISDSMTHPEVVLIEWSRNDQMR